MRALKLGFLLLSAAVIFAAVAGYRNIPCFEGGDGYIFYCGTSSADCKEVRAEGSAKAVRLKLSDVCGESTVYKNFDMENFLADVGGEIVFVEELSDSVNYYCTANLPYSVNLYGKEINLHISVRGDTAKVASPIIFGGY